MSRTRARLLGLAATLSLLLFVIGVPILLLAFDASPTPANLGWSMLTTPDDGTVALAVIGAVAWIAWAVFTVSVVVEIAARTRGLRAPRLPALALPQTAASRVVGFAALLFVSIPTVAAVAHPPRAFADPPSAPTPVSVTAPAQAPHVPLPHPEKDAATTPAPPETEAYTVKRGDSLWRIAEERLGDGTRYVELENLNRHVLGDHPDFLIPGTVLRVPIEAPRDEADSTEGVYVVEPGDTLSEIARDELGNASNYPEIFDASRSTVQPGGAHLSDPDLILPGWRLTIPDQQGPKDNAPAKHRNDHRPPSLPVSPPTTPPNVAPPETPATSTTPATASVDASDHDTALPGWVLPGLAGGGALVAGSLLLVLRQHRRTQLRFRRPGQIVVPPPAELRAAEMSAHASGTVTAPRIEDLDRALRHLGDPSTPCPRVQTVSLDSETAALSLATPADLPSPWTGAGTAWRIRLSEVQASRPGSVAPYPLLVSFGMAADGSLVLINLEEIASAVLAGIPEKAIALGRHIAAELALNPWSALVEVDTVGIGDELATIDPTRLHHHPVGDTAFLDRLASDLEAENPDLEPDQYRALITTAAATDVEAVRKLAKIITSYTGRAGAAVLTIGGEPSESVAEIRLHPDGRVTVPSLSLDLVAAGLSANEARACATLVDITRDAATAPIPADNDPAHPADEAGALKPELTSPRPHDAPAGDASLLPLQVGDYIAAAATVAEDIDRLAPVTSPGTQRSIAEQDPDLDEDVARWQASRLLGPKLTLLGPVSARTLGDARKMAHRRPFYVELLAFLVLHPKGATADEIAEAFGIQSDRARKDVGILRGWLGTDRKTGEPHLPNARQTHTGGVQAKYVVRGVATDLDLFRRLRTRGQSRGAAGIDDLRTALSLVSGEPFSDLRPTGWGWLLEGERIDHVMACAIVDTAHIVTTHAMAVGDLELARFAAETACDAAPYDETSRLDRIAVEKASGDDEQAERHLLDGVLNRSDDDAGPIEMPEPTARILRQHGWDERRARNVG
jgi:LysM repeat protein